jgi:hypothetical protein
MNSLRQILILLLSFVTVFLFILQPICAAESYSTVAGKWQRTDGNYFIKVSDVLPDGEATVEYFNPRSIHVAKAVISTEKKMTKLFIKFQDKGYEGSTYKLYYYAEKDALLGFYYQAPMDKTFEVIFLRKTE